MMNPLPSDPTPQLDQTPRAGAAPVAAPITPPAPPTPPAASIPLAAASPIPLATPPVTPPVSSSPSAPSAPPEAQAAPVATALSGIISAPTTITGLTTAPKERVAKPHRPLRAYVSAVILTIGVIVTAWLVLHILSLTNEQPLAKSTITLPSVSESTLAALRSREQKEQSVQQQLDQTAVGTRDNPFAPTTPPPAKP